MSSSPYKYTDFLVKNVPQLIFYKLCLQFRQNFMLKFV